MADSKVGELQARLVDTVKQYEGKLATLSVFNDALQKENAQLRDELEDCQAPRSATEQDVFELKQEFTRRMAAADKAVARLKEKNEQLRTKLSALNQGGSSAQARLKDREDYITSLQSEGEVLARKNGELESAARKLRAATRESEAERERLTARLQQQEELLAGERERCQMIERQAADQVAQAQVNYEGLQQRAQEQISTALREGEAAARSASEEAERGQNSALQAAVERNAEMEAALDSLRADFETKEHAWHAREESMKSEMALLEANIRQREADVAEAISTASEGTRPLLRQIESMAAAARSQAHGSEDAERRLLESIHRLEEARQSDLEAADAVKADLRQAERNHVAAQKAVTTATQALAEARRELEAERRRGSSTEARAAEAEERIEAAAASIADERAKHDAARQELQQRVWDAQEQVQRLSYELEQARSRPEQPGKRLSRGPSASSLVSEHSALPISTSSQVLDGQGTQMARQVKPPEATGSAPDTAPEDDFDRLFRLQSSYDAASHMPNGHSTGGGFLDDVKAAAMQRRLAEAEATAERANEELLRACNRAEAVQADASRLQTTLHDMQTLQAKHEIALELLGERNERVEALEDDVREMKHIFHSQLSVLVDELNSLKCAR